MSNEQQDPAMSGDITEMLGALAATESMQGVRAASLWALQIAITAARTQDLCGELTIKIPRKPSAPAEFTFRTELPY